MVSRDSEWHARARLAQIGSADVSRAQYGHDGDRHGELSTVPGIRLNSEPRGGPYRVLVASRCVAFRCVASRCDAHGKSARDPGRDTSRLSENARRAFAASARHFVTRTHVHTYAGPATRFPSQTLTGLLDWPSSRSSRSRA